MPFGPTNRPLTEVEAALMATGTSEDSFRTAVVDVARQVDANQIDIHIDRQITLSGDVSGTAAFDISVGDDAVARPINIVTAIESMKVTRDDIDDGAINGAKIEDDSITHSDIASNTLTYENVNPMNTQVVEIYGATGTMPIFRGYVLVPTTP